jgi:hypothetical protein
MDKSKFFMDKRRGCYKRFRVVKLYIWCRYNFLKIFFTEPGSQI